MRYLLLAVLVTAVGGSALVWVFAPQLDIQLRAEEMKSSGTANTDVAALGRLISLDPPPTAVSFQTIELPGGSDWQLIALLEYGPAERARLLEEMPTSSGEYRLKAPDWLSGSLGQLDADESGEYPISGARDAVPFRKSPLLNGYALPLGDDRLLLVMQTQ